MKPIIAITTYGRYEKELATPYYQYHFALPAMYIDAIRRAGGIPFLVPPGEENWDDVLETVDGVLITGGADVNPAEYDGNTTHEKLTRLDPERDKTELTLVQELTNGQYLPTLCICRGMQVLNVALGGSLHEHVADVHPEDIHRGPDGGWTVQEAFVHPQSLLAEVMQAESVATYSGHHQAIKQLGENLNVSATAADGIIEAIEHANLPWLIGVQWHPEITAAEDVTQQRLFDELVQEAIAFKKKRQ
ncbi:MAG: gamma-glutamyl-gamma-aminobutyrate hydrolase family protein [Chloroflexota bacterium]